MPHHSLFDVSPEHIAALDDESLRLLIARLCEADLRTRGLSVSAVLYGGNQTAADGGIDVRVELPADTDIAGFIPRPATGFQAKAEDMRPARIKSEMCPRTKHGDGAEALRLRPSIRLLAEAGGAYVIVSSKSSTADSRLTERREAMRAAVANLDCGGDLYLDFYDQTRMATWVREYAGEILWLRERIGQPLHGWRPFGNWPHAPPGADDEYLSDDAARLRDQTHPQDGLLPTGEGIGRLRSLLSVPGGVVRLTGLSGTGKTRLLEALFDPRVGNEVLDQALAVYVDIGHDAPQPSAGQLASQLISEEKRTVLLLDNCPRETHDAIAPICKSSGSTLSLITVDLDIRDDKPEGTDTFRLQNASEVVIESLLERRYPSLSEAVRRRIAEFSDGNARIANLTAQHVGPETNLANLGDEGLFERLFRQRKRADDHLLQAAEALALVYSFDGETLEGEAAALPFLAETGGFDSHSVHRVVGELKRRDVVQSRGRWRAILPQPLANWLAERALENQPALGVADAFWRCGNPRLLKSFTHRLSYLHDSAEAQQIAKAWLNPGGYLSDLQDVSWSNIDIRFDLVRHLAPVAPAAALNLIERFVLSATLNQLKAGECPIRQPVMSLLRKLAWFPEHFRRASLLLSRFVQAELSNEKRNQNTRYLEELFWSALSGAKAGPQERLAVVEELLLDPESSCQETGMIALRGMLHAGDFTSSHHFSFGSHAIDYGWRPRIFADYRAWYGGVLAIAKQLATSDSPHRNAARSAIAEHFRSLWCFGHVFAELEETAAAIVMKEHWPEGWLAVRKTIALDADRMEVGLLSRLRVLAEYLAPSRFGERVRTYVLTPAHAVADLAHWETAEDYSRAHQAVIDEAQRLGREAGGDTDLLERLWPEMFGPNAYQATWFGEGIAEAVADIPEAWSFLLSRYQALDDEHRNPALLGGFLRSAALKDKESVERFLDDAVSHQVLGGIFPYLQVAVGTDEAGVRRLVASIEIGLAPPKIYGSLAFGRTTETIPPIRLGGIILGIADMPDGYLVAVEMLFMHLHGRRDGSVQWDALLIDCGQRLLRRFPLDQLNQMTDYELATIAEVCLRGNEAAEDARLICRRVVDAQTERLIPRYQLDGFVEALFTSQPQVALDCFLEGVREEWRLRDILSIDLEARNPLSAVSTPVLLEWAHRGPDIRFLRLAGVVPAFAEQDGAAAWSDTAWALLENAPDRSAVLRGLAGQRHPRCWSGSLADILEKRCELIQRFFRDEDPAVRQVAREIDDLLRRDMAAWRTREVERDERFE